jgi:hypothetical protein
MMDHFPMSFGPPPPHPHHGPGEHPDGPPDGPPGPPPKECDSLPAPLCRFLHAVDEKFEAAKHSGLSKFRGCGGHKAGSPHEMPGHQMLRATASLRAACRHTCVPTVLPATRATTATMATMDPTTDTLLDTRSSWVLSQFSSLSWLVSSLV